MNLRLLFITTMSLLFSFLASAQTAVSLNKTDFSSATEMHRGNQAMISATLNSSGTTKIAELNRNAVGKTIHMEIAGVASNFQLREPIKGGSMEMGPFAEADAQKIIAEINQQ